MLRFLRRIGSDVVSGRHIEAYIITVLALIIALLSVIGDDVPMNWQMAAVLAALAVLVFKTTTPPASPVVDLDAVLHDRQSQGPLRDFLHDGREVWIYGPSAVGVLGDGTVLETEIFSRGGTVRVLIQDPREEAAVNILRDQLDTKSDELLIPDIQRAQHILKMLKSKGFAIEYRYLPYGPGFSAVIVDPQSGRDSRAVVEFFGFHNDSYEDRMHIVIQRENSHYWFEHWVSQYQKMWESARLPDADEISE